jgi:major membrane immunogen (membrane-anchored lipoprotein)
MKMYLKKTAIGLVLPIIFLVACSKNEGHHATPPANLSIAGKWNVDSVHAYFYNAALSLDSSEIAYPLQIPPGLYYPIYFQFNDDYSWSESVVVRVDTNVVAKGTYSYTSDSTFNLMYPDANPARKDEPCKIASLTNTSFIFSTLLPTVFNGTDSGYVKYVYRLTK